MKLKWEKLKYYAKRYLVAEIVGTICAIVASAVAFWLTGNKLVASVAGTWGENLGFYSSILVRDIGHPGRHSLRSLGIHLSNLFLEFGPSELLDSFVIRPASMYFFATVIENLALAIFVGKIAADVLFYSVTITAVELRKRWRG